MKFNSRCKNSYSGDKVAECIEGGHLNRGFREGQCERKLGPHNCIGQYHQDKHCETKQPQGILKALSKVNNQGVV